MSLSGWSLVTYNSDSDLFFLFVCLFCSVHPAKAYILFAKVNAACASNTWALQCSFSFVFYLSCPPPPPPLYFLIVFSFFFPIFFFFFLSCVWKRLEPNFESFVMTCSGDIMINIWLRKQLNLFRYHNENATDRSPLLSLCASISAVLNHSKLIHESQYLHCTLRVENYPRCHIFTCNFPVCWFNSLTLKAMP